MCDARVCMVLSPQELNVDMEPQLHTLKVEAPPPRKPGVVLGSVSELVDTLVKTKTI